MRVSVGALDVLTVELSLAGSTGGIEPVVAWAAAACPGIPCVVENSVPATAADCLATLEHMSARCGASHREL